MLKESPLSKSRVNDAHCMQYQYLTYTVQIILGVLKYIINTISFAHTYSITFLPPFVLFEFDDTVSEFSSRLSSRKSWDGHGCWLRL